ncbi:hypothetical protein Patl1_28449 [Pistacia atlantica]|uniref:Uncharacterized protein n=1 Tax=Pistacia atlantica TaxID=434234 RepID=A0ACC1BFI9_9ROSI|nr:hypothetical protein Patl1_28449 [Pistacia atlantica]
MYKCHNIFPKIDKIKTKENLFHQRKFIVVPLHRNITTLAQELATLIVMNFRIFN